MTKQELAKIMSYLFADFDAQVKNEKLLVWFDQFKHVDNLAGWAAAKLLLTRKSYGLPKAQDFAAALQRVVGGAETTGADAFDQAYGAAGRFGRYQKEVGLSSLPTLVRMAAERFGWEALCACESPELQRGQFARVYESLDRRRREAATISPELKAEIKAIAGGEAKALPGPERAGDILGRIGQ